MSVVPHRNELLWCELEEGRRARPLLGQSGHDTKSLGFQVACRGDMIEEGFSFAEEET